MQGWGRMCQGDIICKTGYSMKQWLKMNRKWDYGGGHETNSKLHIQEVTVRWSSRAIKWHLDVCCGAQSGTAGGTSLRVFRTNEICQYIFHQHFNLLGSSSVKGISHGLHTSHLFSSYFTFQPNFLEMNVTKDFSSSPTFCISFTINIKREFVHSTLRLPLLVNICHDC